MCSTYLSNTQVRPHHTKPWLTPLAPNLRPHHLQFNWTSWFFKSLHWLSLLYIDLCLKIRSRPSSVTTRSSNYIFFEVPRSKKLAFSVSAPKLWNSLQNTIKDVSSLDILNSFEIIFISRYHVFSNFAFSGIYFDFICFLYCILRFSCILRKRRFIYCIVLLLGSGLSL